MLRPSKFGFSRITEDVCYLPLLAPFNPIIEIFERPAQKFAERPAHSAFASAHKADQDYGPRPLSGLAIEHTKPGRRSLRTGFAPIRFAVRFAYCFLERFLR